MTIITVACPYCEDGHDPETDWTCAVCEGTGRIETADVSDAAIGIDWFRCYQCHQLVRWLARDSRCRRCTREELP